jgi:uncharacterized protein
VIYLDTSALAKLLIDEPESAALDAWLEARPGPLLTSVLAEVELALTLTRMDKPPALGDQLLRGVARVEITDPLRRRAASMGTVRTLDAIHVATALGLDALAPGTVIVVTYDKQMAAAAASTGLATAAPS